MDRRLVAGITQLQDTGSEYVDDGWYTRREGIIRGPFTAEIVTRYILLGRISLEDEISPDRTSWSAVSALTGLLPEEISSLNSWQDYQQLVLARLAVDERRMVRRDSMSGQSGHSIERRSGHERRQVDAARTLMRSVFGGSAETDSSPAFMRTRLLAVLVLAVVVIAWLVPAVR